MNYIYHIFRSTKFGIEIEACNDINIEFPNYEIDPIHLKYHLERQFKLRTLYNKLIEYNVVPKMDDNYFKFAEFLIDIGYTQ